MIGTRTKSKHLAKSLAWSALTSLVLLSIRSKRLKSQVEWHFGAHTYERTDKPRGEFYHYDWYTEE